MASLNLIYESGWATQGSKQPVRLVAIVFFSISIALVLVFGIEARCFGDASTCAISGARAIETVMDRGQRPVTVRWQIKTETAYMYPSLSLEEILRRFTDARIDPAERRLFAYRLA